MTGIMNFINTAIVACVGWFNKVFFSSGVIDVYLVCLFICLLVRFIIQPIVGAATFTAASDRVRKHNENSRYKGKHERNQKGRYVKK